MQIGEEIMTKKIIVLSQLLVTWESIFKVSYSYNCLNLSSEVFHLSDFTRQPELELKYLLSGFSTEISCFQCMAEKTHDPKHRRAEMLSLQIYTLETKYFFATQDAK